jgi:hypothetical protein
LSLTFILGLLNGPNTKQECIIFICGLFHNAVDCSYASNYRMVHERSDCGLTEGIIPAYGVTNENHETSVLGKLVSGPRFESWTSRIRRSSTRLRRSVKQERPSCAVQSCDGKGKAVPRA